MKKFEGNCIESRDGSFEEKDGKTGLATGKKVKLWTLVIEERVEGELFCRAFSIPYTHPEYEKIKKAGDELEGKLLIIEARPAQGNWNEEAKAYNVKWKFNALKEPKL